MHKRIQNYAFLAIIGAVVLVGVAVLVPPHQEFREAKGNLTAVEDELARQEEQILRLRREISSLRNDYRAIERVAREKFGYCKDGEKIYHFDKPPPEP